MSITTYPDPKLASEDNKTVRITENSELKTDSVTQTQLLMAILEELQLLTCMASEAWDLQGLETEEV